MLLTSMYNGFCPTPAISAGRFENVGNRSTHYHGYRSLRRATHPCKRNCRLLYLRMEIDKKGKIFFFPHLFIGFCLPAFNGIVTFETCHLVVLFWDLFLNSSRSKVNFHLGNVDTKTKLCHIYIFVVRFWISF